jgi:hypothetical protein
MTAVVTGLGTVGVTPPLSGGTGVNDCYSTILLETYERLGEAAS